MQHFPINLKCLPCFKQKIMRKTNKSNSDFIKWTNPSWRACTHGGKIKNLAYHSQAASAKAVYQIPVYQIPDLVKILDLVHRPTATAVAGRDRS